MKSNILIILLLFSTTSIFGQWALKFNRDSFGDPTDEKYINFSDRYGSFSNSATSNSSLIANTIVNYSYDNDSIPIFWFELYEYADENNQSVGKVIGDASYDLSIKLSNDSTYWYELNPGKTTLNLWHNLNNRRLLFNLLKKESKPIKCCISIDGEYGDATYNFKINPVGFSSAFSKLGQNLVYKTFNQ